MLHAIAHIKAAEETGRKLDYWQDDPSGAFAGWNDSDPAFLTEFYGLLECCAEEMFFPPQAVKGSRAEGEERSGGYRPRNNLTTASLQELDGKLRSLAEPQRAAFLKQHFGLTGGQ